LNMYSYYILSKLNIENKDYITVNYGSDAELSGNAQQTKLWPFYHHEKFVKLFKNKHPEILVVQIGISDKYRMAEADIYAFNLKLEEVKIILKYSNAHIDCEGGLVHLSTQLSTKCVVCFGPTPSYFYGYPQNKNIVPPGCTDCMSIFEDWYTVCYRNDDNEHCMTNILPEQVLESVSEILTSRQTYSYELLGRELYSSAKLEDYRPVIDKIVANNEMQMIGDNDHIFGPCRTYIHASKRWEYPYIIEAVEKQGKYLKIADVGCGRGALGVYLASQHHDVSIYDMDFNWDNEGDRFYNNRFMLYCADNNVKAQYGTVFNIPVDDNTFDVVISCSVVEHIQYKKYALLEMLRVLKPYGVLIMTYDLRQDKNKYVDEKRPDVFSSESIEHTLLEIGIEAEIYEDKDVLRSIKDIRESMPLMAETLTVGGLVIKKLKGGV